MTIRYPWDKLTPREVWDALSSAPKIAGPWTAVGQRFHRSDARGVAVVHSEEDGSFCFCQLGLEESIADAPTRDAADATLRELGWLLVDEPVAP